MSGVDIQQYLTGRDWLIFEDLRPKVPYTGRLLFDVPARATIVAVEVDPWIDEDEFGLDDDPEPVTVPIEPLEP